MEEGSPEGTATVGVILADGYMLVKRAGRRGEIPQHSLLLPSRIPPVPPLVNPTGSQWQRSQEDSVCRGEPPQHRAERQERKKVEEGVTRENDPRKGSFPCLL